MKTVREYLEELPEPYRTQAIWLYSNSINYNYEMEAEDIQEALSAAFVWDKTTNGHNYWANLYYYLTESDELIKEASQILNK